MLIHILIHTNNNGKGDEEMTENTPEARVEMYKEIAAQKKEKQDREGIHLCMYVCMYQYIHVYIYIYICMHWYMKICVSLCS